MRLLDKILTGEFQSSPHFNKTELLRFLAQSQLVVADNVLKYMLENRAGDIVSPSDFPCVMLPFEYTFIEVRIPRSTQWSTWAEEGGVLLSMNEPKAPEKSGFVSDEMIEWSLRPEVKFHLHATVFFNSKEDGLCPMCRLIMPVTEDGRLTTGDDTKFWVIVDRCLPIPGYEEFPEALRDEHLKCAGWILPSALMAISFMHCRNVAVKKETPPLLLSKKHEKRTGRPLLRYHVIQIDHMKQVLEREGNASTEGLKKALHICRGHFKH